MTAAADLAAIMYAAAARVDQAALDHIEAMGVDRGALAHLTPSLGWPAIGIVDAEPAGNGLFAPGEGPRHIVQPVTIDGELIDLVAWRSLRPDDWRLLRGTAWLLGQDAINHALEWPQDGPIAMHRTPRDWLAAGGTGFCILDWEAPEVRILIELDAIEAPDSALRDTLRAILSKSVRLPRMTIGSHRDAA